MARRALAAYLRHGYDAAAGRYYGRLDPDGSPNLEPRETPYMPGDHSSVWEFLFPTHDYPMPMAMAALQCAAGGPDAPLFAGAARNWAAAARAEVESWPEGQVRYAEHYGRLIVYFAEYARLAGEPAYRDLAAALAGQAVQRLDAGSLLLGRTNADWYDAIDGVGFLALALLHLEAPDPGALDLF